MIFTFVDIVLTLMLANSILRSCNGCMEHLKEGVGASLPPPNTPLVDGLLMFRLRASFWSLLESKETTWRESWERELLRSVLMTTCDIAAITKPWHVQLRAANLVLTEFFDQGDKEKHQLKIQPQVPYVSHVNAS